jgi:hypothetical protein
MCQRSNAGARHRRRFAGGVGLCATILLAACQTGASAVPSVPAVPSVELPSSLPQAFVQFESSGSGLSGGAILFDSGGQTSVVITLLGGDPSTPMPSVLFEGDCASFPGIGAPAASAPAASAPAASAVTSSASVEAPSASAGALFQLESVVGGTSTSTVPLAVSELTATAHSIAILAAAEASMAPASASTGSGAPSASAMAAESDLPAAPSAGSSAAIIACGEVTNVPPPGLPSGSGSAAPSGGSNPHEPEIPTPSSPEGSMTEPSPSS